MAARGRPVADRLVIIVSLVLGLGAVIWFGLAITPNESLTEASGPEYETRLEAAQAFFDSDPERVEGIEKRTRRMLDRTIDKLKLDYPEPSEEQEVALNAAADAAYGTAVAEAKAEALKFRALHYTADELTAIAEGSWAIHIHIRTLIKQETMLSETAAYRETLRTIRQKAADRLFCEGRDILSGLGERSSNCEL